MEPACPPSSLPTFQPAHHPTHPTQPPRPHPHPADERTTEFLWAAAGGDPRTVRQSLGTGIVSVNAADYDGRTALELACAKGHSEVVALLLGAGANPNQLDNLGSCALLEACKSGQDEIIGLLLRHGAALSEGEVQVGRGGACGRAGRRRPAGHPLCLPPLGRPRLH